MRKPLSTDYRLIRVLYRVTNPDSAETTSELQRDLRVAEYGEKERLSQVLILGVTSASGCGPCLSKKLQLARLGTVIQSALQETGFLHTSAGFCFGTSRGLRCRRTAWASPGSPLCACATTAILKCAISMALRPLLHPLEIAIGYTRHGGFCYLSLD